MWFSGSTLSADLQAGTKNKKQEAAPVFV